MSKTIERFAMPMQLDEPQDGKPVIAGYAIKWDSPSQDLGGFRRVFAKGCFTESLASGQEVMALYAHEDNDLVGRQANGSLRIIEDETGLRYELDPPAFDPKFCGRIASKLVDKVSVGVTDASSEWTEGADGLALRTITQATLVEISFTAYPAFTDTSAEMLMLNDWKAAQADKPPQSEALGPVGPVGEPGPAGPVGIPDKPTHEPNLMIALVQQQAELIQRVSQ